MRTEGSIPNSGFYQGLKSFMRGIRLTFKHFRKARHRRKPLGVDDDNYFCQTEGSVTTFYPHETVPVPDNGRYRLYNEIEDCIVCDLCAKICPVDCIEIDAIKSPEEIGKTSDGTTRRLYAGKFDIDMAKCCYCGLCTTVCPTECLTMTKTYDYSEFDIRNMVYHFSDLSPEEADQKKKEFEQFMEEKARLKKEQKEKAGNEKKPSAKPKPKLSFKPKVKPSPKGDKPSGDAESKKEEGEKTEKKAKPKFKPKMKPNIRKKPSSGDSGKGKDD